VLILVHYWRSAYKRPLGYLAFAVTFLHIVNNKNLLLQNCPITRKDIMAAKDILGPDMSSLKGKTVRGASLPVDIKNMSLVPATAVMLCYRDVTLCGDIIFLNKILFLMTVSRDLKFGTVKRIQNQKGPMILKAIKAVTKIYQRCGFKITNLLMDGQFEPIRCNLSGLHITLNTVSNAEYIHKIER
jgi:hypothetical protein